MGGLQKTKQPRQTHQRQFDEVDNDLVSVREKGKGEREKAIFTL